MDHKILHLVALGLSALLFVALIPLLLIFSVAMPALWIFAPGLLLIIIGMVRGFDDDKKRDA